MVTVKTTPPKKVKTTAGVYVEVYQKKSGSNWSVTDDVVCEINGGALLIKLRASNYPVAALAQGQWLTMNVAPI